MESTNKILQLRLSRVQVMVVVLTVTVEPHLGPGNLVLKKGMFPNPLSGLELLYYISLCDISNVKINALCALAHSSLYEALLCKTLIMLH